MDDRLPVGIVEYVVIAGPSSLPPVKLSQPQPKILPAAPSPAIDEFVLDTFIGDSGSEGDNGSYGSNLDAEEIPGDIEDQDRIMDVQIYDRFPKQDYPRTPLPAKVEWFVFPEGSISIYAAER